MRQATKPVKTCDIHQVVIRAALTSPLMPNQEDGGCGEGPSPSTGTQGQLWMGDFQAGSEGSR